jgi:predicted nucleic acid-binding protein
VNPETTFIDTWGWMALGHRRDPRHAEVAQLIRTLRSERSPIYTTDYILDELITLLYRRETFAEATRFVDTLVAAEGLGQLTVARVTPERFAAAWQLRRRLDDKPRISFTDLVSMVVMDELDIVRVLTDDDHFLHVGLGFHKVP